MDKHLLDNSLMPRFKLLLPMQRFLEAFLVCVVGLSVAQTSAAPAPATGVERTPDRATFTKSSGKMKLMDCCDNIVRVKPSTTASLRAAQSSAVANQSWHVPIEFPDYGDKFKALTQRPKFTVDNATRALALYVASSDLLLGESAGGGKIKAVLKADGESSRQAGTEFHQSPTVNFHAVA